MLQFTEQKKANWTGLEQFLATNLGLLYDSLGLLFFEVGVQISLLCTCTSNMRESAFSQVVPKDHLHLKVFTSLLASQVD